MIDTGVIPEALLVSKSWLIEKYVASCEHPLKSSVERLILTSDYVGRNIHILNTLLAEDSCAKLLTREDYFNSLDCVTLAQTPQGFAQELRYVRHYHYLRLLLLQMAGVASVEEVMSSWSACADALILHALAFCKHSVSARFGLPYDEHNNEVQLFTLAMGKLGGNELNYSSDIDLIFAFTAAGTTRGAESIDNQTYFSKMVQQFIPLLQTITPEGFVFRVDLRLRPNGDSGPLVSSLAAMETYYQEQGRDWERYAMVKARVISRDSQIYSWFTQLIKPFVYRRYVDFSVIESLRSMKAMIEREVQLNPRLDDIKRGQGGIREIEFIIQNEQLIRGGRLPQLQQQNAMAALQVLKEQQLLPRSDALKQAYLFLRELENVLQSMNDQQTHSLPEDLIKRAQVFLAMGYSDWDSLVAKLQQYQRIVSHSFHTVLGTVVTFEDEKKLVHSQFASIWQGHVEPTMAANLFASFGYNNAEHCYQMINTFRHSPRCRRLTQGARLRLDRFMVLLLNELTHFVTTDTVLLNAMHLLENTVGRSAYLALLTENPQALRELLFWFSNSPFISSLFVTQPFLLEILLGQEKNWRPASRAQLEKKLKEQLHLSTEPEAQEDILRQFKLINWLMAARAELYGYCSAIRVGQFLSDVAQVIVNQVVASACQELSFRFPEISGVEKGFAVIAYGKLGSREMNYSSDLDLVFLHTMSQADEGLVTRLTKKILHRLTARSQAGILYTVDTRLRPSGSAGLLVSHLDAFIDYQQNQAWTWEHQALLKARIIKGPSSIKRQFMHLKKTVLAMPRSATDLQQEVLAMRKKIDMHQENEPLKHAPGGLLDLEFLVQFLLLRQQNREFASKTHTLSQIKQLHEIQVINEAQFLLLKKAYRDYHYGLHHQLLQAEVVDCSATQQQVVTLCANVYMLSS